MSVAANERALWQRAECLLPQTQVQETMPIYTQGMMDLGATVCTLRRPVCLLCPLAADCVATKEGEPERYPVKTRRLKRTQLELWLLQVIDPEGRVWLEPRPAPGIWAGLHCMPSFESRDELMTQLPSAAHGGVVEHQPFMHVLTHRDLYLRVVTCHLGALAFPMGQGKDGAWFNEPQWQAVGLPAPVRRFLENT